MQKNECAQTQNTIRTSLTFFSNKSTQINTQRLQIKRSKNLASFFAKPLKNQRSIQKLDTTLGVLSFAIYISRFFSNLVLLQHEEDEKKRQALQYTLFNDFLWASINLIQFFWLSFKKSTSAGYLGMQLEAIGQFTDLLVSIIRYLEDKEEYDKKYNLASKEEQERMTIEWKYKELDFYRTLMTSASTFFIFALSSFRIIFIPLSPVIGTITFMSSLVKIVMAMKKDQETLQLLKDQNADPAFIAQKKQELFFDRMQELNQTILYNVFYPLALFLLISAPIPVMLLSTAIMAAIYIAFSQFITMLKAQVPEETGDKEHLEQDALMMPPGALGF